LIGQTLAHYKIVKKIGAGGMGDVYLAEDTKLSRQVALKVLPPELAENEERRARFQREAKAIAALDHSNIVQVFSVEEADGVHFIAMQLVKGKTLAELIPKGGLPLDKFFDCSIPLAGAVAAAHEAGIIHRDLKPANVMVSDEGIVKVLDFGLARQDAPIRVHDVSESPTALKTQEGIIAGTLHYMSPEQAEGKRVDQRSDIFSLGIMFYEMLTGARPFQGNTATAVLSSILKDTPDSISDLKAGVPNELAKIVRRCLAKEPGRRYQTTFDVRNELKEAGAIKASRSSRGPWLAAAGLTVAVIVWLSGINPTADRTSSVPRLANPIQITSATGIEDHPDWSPDGSTLAFSGGQAVNLMGGNWDIWVKQAGGGPAVNRTPDYAGDDRYPTWSPDGTQIAFWSERDGGGYYVMPALAGPARRVFAAPLHQPSPPQWSVDGEELAGLIKDESSNYVHIVSLKTGETRRVSAPGRREERFDLAWSSDGRYFAYVDGDDLYNNLSQLWILRAADGEAFAVTDGTSSDWGPSWSADGRTVYFVSNRGGSSDMWQLSVATDGSRENEPNAITVGIGIRHAFLSPDGKKLAYSKGRTISNVWRLPILADRPATWEDAQQITFDQSLIEMVDVSPDGRQLLIDSDRAGNADLWTFPADGGEMRQLTTGAALDWGARWSPEADEIAFYSTRSGNRDLWSMSARGGAATRLTNYDGIDRYPAWSHDGREIAFHSDRSGNPDIWVLTRESGELRRLTTNPSADQFADWSLDNQYLVFHSDRDGQHLWRIPASGGEPELLTERAAGWHARWSLSGKEVYFQGADAQDGNVWSISVDDRVERQLTDLRERPGFSLALDTDGAYIYLVWLEELGDLWVMDVIHE